MTEIKAKEVLLRELHKLKYITDFSGLYLANYFIDLRNKVDKKFVTKLARLKEDDKDVKSKLNVKWLEIIAKIQLFEKNCFKRKFYLEANKQRINTIESSLSNEKALDLKALKEEIKNEEISLMQVLFQNKTIVYVDYDDLFQESKIELIDGLLIVLNDESISHKCFSNG